jgi:mannose-1-phosphate guanylyltransferase/phosphomannomutase
VLDLIPSGTEFDFSQNLYPKMLAEGRRLYGYVAEGYWRDIGNNEEYFQCHQDLLDGKLRLGDLGQKFEQNGAVIWAGKGAQWSPNVQFSGTVILGDGVKIGPRAKLYNSVIGANSIVGRKHR